MGYEIRVVKKETRDGIKREWVKLRDYTTAENAERYGRGEAPETYGYKEGPTREIVEIELLKQNVDELNLVAVIRAINGI